MIAVARSISHGEAYQDYAQKKDKNGVPTAVFVGAKNMVGNVDLVFDSIQLDDMWFELKEAGRDYVRKGKDVIRDVIAIECSPTKNESLGWTTDEWLLRAKELLTEIDKVQLSKPRRCKKTKEWILDGSGKKKMFPVPLTDLSNSKWLAYLHTDSASGIPHLHIIISRYTEDSKLNCDTDIAKKAAQACETINERYAWTKAEDIRSAHIEEINVIINGILNNIDGDEIDFDYFKKGVESATFIDYKGNTKTYKLQYHYDDKGQIDGYSIKRGNSIFTANELGQKIANIAVDRKREIKDAIYKVLRDMNGNHFNWLMFKVMMEATGKYGIELKFDTEGKVVRYDVKCHGRTYNASQIGANVTARKILREWKKEQAKVLEAIRHKEAALKNDVQNSHLKPIPTSNQEPLTVHKNETTEGKHERTAAIGIARDTLQKWIDRHAAIFSDREEERLAPGIIAKCIEDGYSPYHRDDLEDAARGFGDMVSGWGSATVTAATRMAQLAWEMFQGIAMPPEVSSGGSGGADSNDLPRKKDDDWEWWKRHSFGIGRKGRGRVLH